jgi:hypothetical protein
MRRDKIMEEITDSLLLIWKALAISAENWLKNAGIVKYSAWTLEDELMFVGLFYISILLIMGSVHRKVALESKDPRTKYVYVIAYPLVITSLVLMGIGMG